MFRLHRWHQANISGIELYIDFKEVAIAQNHQVVASQHCDEAEPSTFPKIDIEWEINNAKSDEEDFEGEYRSGVDDDADDDDEAEEDVSNTVGNQHPYEEPYFVCTLDLEAMYT